MAKDESWSAETATLASTNLTEVKSPSSRPAAREFHTLEVLNTGFNMTIGLPGYHGPLFYVRNSCWFGRPDVTLTSGGRDGRVLGVLRLSHFHQNTLCLGDHNHGEVVYEGLRKTSRWTHSRYEFDMDGIGGIRTFVWQRTGQGFSVDQPDLELREKISSSPGVDGEGQLGEVLAVYRGNGWQGYSKKLRGTFSIRKYVQSEMMEHGSMAGWSDWELMVLLSACGLIEASRRRARAKRAAQHGMPFSS